MLNNSIEAIIDITEKNRELILKTERDLWKIPEVGYKEWKTTDYLKKEFEKLGYSVTMAGDIPGFIADIEFENPGPKIGIVGELDALFCETHPEANPDTKAVHACGHHCQVTNVLGCAAVFANKNTHVGLSGSVRFVCVPAEETIDLEFRRKLIEDGVINFVAGKIEFLHRGLLDDVDMIILLHTINMERVNEPDKLFVVNSGSDGCITKHFEYQGVAAHAGVYPERGINALYAASLGLQACNSLRETFTEKDYIRWHPIITQAGVAANAIPDVAKLDSYVRASTVQTMIDTNQKINRALTGAAVAMGANLLIEDMPGNMPLHNNEEMQSVFIEVCDEIFGDGMVVRTGWATDCSDMGDMSSIMPVMQPHVAGAGGKAHGQDYEVIDAEKATINSTKAVCGTVVKLLENDGARAKEILKNYIPAFKDKEEYFKTIKEIKMRKQMVIYEKNGTISLNC